MRHIGLVFLFCVMGCAETHLPPDTGDGDVTPYDGGGVENDSSVDPTVDSGRDVPDADAPDSSVDTDADVPTCGSLAADVETSLRVNAATNDCEGPLGRARFFDVTPERGTAATRCQNFSAEVTAVCGTSLQTWLLTGRWVRTGLVYTSEPFEFGCEGVSYMCTVLHDAASDTVSLSCTYEGLSCEVEFTR